MQPDAGAGLPAGMGKQEGKVTNTVLRKDTGMHTETRTV